MPPKGGGKKKAAPKSAERVALDEQFRTEKESLELEEERMRLELELSETLARKECKRTKRQETFKVWTDKDKEIDTLKTKIAEITKTTTTQIVKLEDELSRLGMSKEVVTQNLSSVQNELAKLKADDGGKKIISQLQSKLEQMEAEKSVKNKEMEEREDELSRKLAKQITENRLLRIQHKDTEADWTRRISQLETEMRTALEELIASKEAEDPKKVTKFTEAMDKSTSSYLQFLAMAREKVIGMADTLVDAKSMHSNLPRRIKTELEKLSVEQLLLIIDALSFEESVLQYLEAKFYDPDQGMEANGKAAEETQET